MSPRRCPGKRELARPSADALSEALERATIPEAATPFSGMRFGF